MTTTAQETDLRYPVGKFDFDAPLSEADYPKLIAAIAETPAALRSAVAGLSRDQIETRYRPGGWTVKQVVHHVPDSHMNAYTRFKLALTEDEPTIKPYDEAAWAELPDSQKVPIEVSLNLLDAIHVRWVTVLRSMDTVRLPPRSTASGTGPSTYSCTNARALRLARATPRRTHHIAEKEGRLVSQFWAPALPLLPAH